MSLVDRVAGLWTENSLSIKANLNVVVRKLQCKCLESFEGRDATLTGVARVGPIALLVAISEIPDNRVYGGSLEISPTLSFLLLHLRQAERRMFINLQRYSLH